MDFMSKNSWSYDFWPKTPYLILKFGKIIRFYQGQKSDLQLKKRFQEKKLFPTENLHAKIVGLSVELNEIILLDQQRERKFNDILFSSEIVEKNLFLWFWQF